MKAVLKHEKEKGFRFLFRKRYLPLTMGSAIVLVSLGVLFFLLQIRTMRKQKIATLQAIAHLKSGEILNWKAERMADADYFSGNPDIIVLAELLNSGESSAKGSILFRQTFNQMNKNHRYRNIMLVNEHGEVGYSLDPVEGTLAKEIIPSILHVLETDSIHFIDLQYNRLLNLIHMDVVAPVKSATGRNWVLIFRIDPLMYFFPMLQSWPVPTTTSEILLIRKESNDVIYLNELRHVPHTAMKLRIPLTEDHIPAVRAIRGKTGISYGRDYQNRRVIAFSKKIETTPWYLVAKMDRRELFADLAVMTGMLVLVIVSLETILLSFLSNYIHRQWNIELEAQVESRTLELKEANRELEAFAYTVSHDLRTPLRAIDGFTKLLDEGYRSKLDEEGLRLLGIIGMSARKMGQLIDSLLSFSRLGRIELERKNVHMEELARTSLEAAKAVYPDRKIIFTTDNLPAVKGDPVLLEQVWLNLLSNAIKFSSYKNQTEISVTCKPAEGFFVFSVRDNGAGFDMKYTAKLFQVFQRLHNTRQFEGNGVGLAIVQRIIQRHGGRVWAEGKTGEGAEISFTLPSNNL